MADTQNSTFVSTNITQWYFPVISYMVSDIHRNYQLEIFKILDNTDKTLWQKLVQITASSYPTDKGTIECENTAKYGNTTVLTFEHADSSTTTDNPLWWPLSKIKTGQNTSQATVEVDSKATYYALFKSETPLTEITEFKEPGTYTVKLNKGTYNVEMIAGSGKGSWLYNTSTKEMVSHSTGSSAAYMVFNMSVNADAVDLVIYVPKSNEDAYIAKFDNVLHKYVNVNPGNSTEELQMSTSTINIDVAKTTNKEQCYTISNDVDITTTFVKDQSINGPAGTGQTLDKGDIRDSGLAKNEYTYGCAIGTKLDFSKESYRSSGMIKITLNTCKVDFYVDEEATEAFKTLYLSQNMTYDHNSIVSQTGTPTKETYNFTKWNLSDTGDNILTIHNETEKTIYGVWTEKPKKYYLKLKEQNGKITPINVTIDSQHYIKNVNGDLYCTFTEAEYTPSENCTNLTTKICYKQDSYFSQDLYAIKFALPPLTIADKTKKDAIDQARNKIKNWLDTYVNTTKYDLTYYKDSGKTLVSDDNNIMYFKKPSLYNSGTSSKITYSYVLDTATTDNGDGTYTITGYPTIYLYINPLQNDSSTSQTYTIYYPRFKILIPTPPSQ